MVIGNWPCHIKFCLSKTWKNSLSCWIKFHFVNLTTAEKPTTVYHKYHQQGSSFLGSFLWMITWQIISISIIRSLCICAGTMVRWCNIFIAKNMSSLNVRSCVSCKWYALFVVDHSMICWEDRKPTHVSALVLHCVFFTHRNPGTCVCMWRCVYVFIYFAQAIAYYIFYPRPCPEPIPIK